MSGNIDSMTLWSYVSRIGYYSSTLFRQKVQYTGKQMWRFIIYNIGWLLLGKHRFT